MADEATVVVSAPAAVPAEPAAPQPTMPSEESTPAAPSSRTFSQEDVDKIVSKRLSKAQRQWERQQQSLLETALSARQERVAPAAPSAEDKEPNPSDFTDYGDYVQAKIDFGVRRALKQHGQSLSQRQTEAIAQQRQQDLAATVRSQYEAGAQKYEDFDDVVMDPALPMTQTVVEVLSESDIGADIAYYLAKHPSELRQIAGLSPSAAARAIGKIEAKLEAAPPPPKSSAPAPVTPAKGGASGEKDPSTMSDAEFAAWRRKQKAAKYGG